MKKLKAVFYVILIIAILAIIYAFYKLYKPGSNLNKNNNSTSSIATSTPITMEEKNISDKNDFYEITAKYPVDSRDKDNILEKFVLYNINNLQKEWATGSDAYNGEMQLRKDFPDHPKTIYTYNLDYKSYNIANTNIVSYVLSGYEFTGGAHGNTAINTFTFDKDGQIKIEDILDFGTGNGIKLTKLLESELIKQKGDMLFDTKMVEEALGIAYLKSDGTIDKEKCNCDGFYMGSNFQNFYLTKDGITIIFPQYQVAPYAAGIIEVNMSWDELKPYLVDNKIMDLATGITSTEN